MSFWGKQTAYFERRTVTVSFLGDGLLKNQHAQLFNIAGSSELRVDLRLGSRCGWKKFQTYIPTKWCFQMVMNPMVESGNKNHLKNKHIQVSWVGVFF